jgi:signal recognition particle receptor subunit beta
LEEASLELDNLLQEERLNGIPLLVFANKQDLLNAKKAAEVCTFSYCLVQWMGVISGLLIGVLFCFVL